MVYGIFSVKYITSKNSFCYLSPQNSKYLDNGVAVKVICNDNKIIYLSPQPLAGLQDNEIGINRLQALALDLLENDNVMVNVCYSIPGVKRITVSPASKDDYEILEILAETIESTLLNQIRVVNENQKFVIWVTDSLHVTVNVDAVEPVNPGRLDNLTEVVIAQPSSKIIDDVCENAETDSKWSFHKLFDYFNESQNAVESPNDIGKKYANVHYPLGFVLLPVEEISKFVTNKKIQYFNVFVSRKHWPKNFPKLDCFDIVNLKIVIPPVLNHSLIEENGMTIKTIAVHVIILEDDVISEKVPKCAYPVLYMHDCIFQNFCIKSGSKAFLNSRIKFFPNVNSVEITTTKGNCKSAEEEFKLFINKIQGEKVLLNANVLLKINSDFNFSLKFTPLNANFCLVDSEFIRNCKLTVSDSQLVIDKSEAISESTTIEFLEDFGNCKEIINESVFLLKLGLTNRNAIPENVLITGKLGTGKTTLINILSSRLSLSPFYFHSETISCKNVKGKSLESLHRVLSAKILNLIYYQPSILILDDLHIICEKVAEGDNLTQESLHFYRISEMIAGLLKKISNYNKIAILATSESVFKLNQHIFASRGQHLFKNVFSINELTKRDRTSMLEFLFRQKCTLKDLNIEEQLSLKTEGFVIQDLVNFVDKAIFESLKEEETAVTEQHCIRALQNTTALSLKDIQLHSPGDRDFSDIGGLEDVKKILVECMMWPVQYPNLFGHAPLRLQSGLLLYGPPGTGKTILAGAAAKHCGLRLISIKGPELLSKYIGASEQAVRNIFEKAQSAKPCILFFDEFDSLAPRRGHDSTGVTDRVVNQFLTQLDGIESLSGVCVLAATSRPDLLDPALLRPGRLDRQILCPLPNKDSRLKILKSLSKKMVFAGGVDLSKIAERTNSYSGADLQSILYTAQLGAVEHLLEVTEGKTDKTVEINQNHLEEALRNTRPSLTKEEQLKYKRIYSKFQEGSDLSELKSGLQRATLA